MAYQGEIIGEHPSMVETRRLISRIAKSPVRTVLIYGETGTGKGMVARSLHEESDRANHEFLNVNCAAIPANLMESELFGFEKGAFTGALTRKTGLVGAADGGSIFLDEIRELDPVLQAKLLNVLDTQEFRRVGAVRSQKVDVSFIAATNRILFSEVQAGRFRDDLYYRLQVVSINIPALREIFLTYQWPGNVRELENLLERIFILEDGREILARHIPPRIMREVNGEAPARVVQDHVDVADRDVIGVDSALDFHARTAAYQRHMIERSLAEGGGITAAALALGISRHSLRHQMKKLGL